MNWAPPVWSSSRLYQPEFFVANQAVAEKEALARQVEAGRGHQELTRLLNEQEQVVAELRQEGEQLSKKHLQQVPF